MNTARLLVVVVILLGVGLVLNSRSTLNPVRGADHVFYGAAVPDFLGQFAVVGDFDNDGFDDIVSSVKWDNPAPGGATLEEPWTRDFQCLDSPPAEEPKEPWGTIIARKSGVWRRVCDFPGEFGDDHWDYWQSLGWEEVARGDCNLCDPNVPPAQCDSCYSYAIRSEDQGALHVLDGAADWSGKGHDINFATTPSDHLITGKNPGDLLYNGMAVGKVTGDAFDDLVAGAIHANGTGEAYVIAGGSSWPSTIALSSSGLVANTLIGRDDGDEFGKGIAIGDLNGDLIDEIIVAAPKADGPTGLPRIDGGEVIIFYSGEGMPSTADLSGLSDTAVNALGYASLIFGPANSTLGVTHIGNTHAAHQGEGQHNGGYDPVGIAIGKWDDDDFNDLVIGAGNADAGNGAVYVIFGGGPPFKLVPGNTIDLSNPPSGNLNAPDMKIIGKAVSYFGTGIAFVDANDEGELARKIDLIMGAPLTTVGKSQQGEAYIIYGDTRANLLSQGTTRNLGTGATVDVRFIGEDAGDRLGSQFEGNADIDGDLNNDLGMTGEAEQWVVFIEDGGGLDPVVDLFDIETDDPQTRVIKMVGQWAEPAVTTAHSVTIRFADIDGDQFADLVFGGYDLPGWPGNASGALHAGEMWVTKGQDLWQSGLITTNTTWSGNVFVNGDLVVANGATLTIAAGTDVWIWPVDAEQNGLGSENVSVEFLVDGNLVVDGDNFNPVRFLVWTSESFETTDNSAWYGIFVRDVYPTATATIENCIVKNATRAIQARSTVTVRNVTISDCLLRGVSVASANADDVLIESTIVIGAEIGFRFADGAEATLNGCTVQQSGITGIRIASGAHVTVNGGAFGSHDYGAEVTCDGTPCATSATFDGVSFPAANVVGVSVNGAVSGGVRNGTVVGATDGIICTGALSNFVIENNAITVSGANGITCVGGDPPIRGNTITQCASGIYCDNLATPVIRANSIKDNGVGVTALNDANPNLGQGCSGSCVGSGSCPSEGGNSFKTNSSHDAVNLSPSITLMAECNFWKKKKISGAVDSAPEMGSDPLPVSPFPDGTDTPRSFALSPNHPNPFNPVTTLRYEVPAPGGQVSIRIFDVAGRLVRTLVNANETPGYHEQTWAGLNERGDPVASGVYFVQMIAEGFVQTRKMVLLK